MAQEVVDRFDSTEPLYGYSQTLFPIVQGSGYRDLRTQSAEYIASFEREEMPLVDWRLGT